VEWVIGNAGELLTAGRANLSWLYLEYCVGEWLSFDMSDRDGDQDE
jgi:hypothetical protein